MNWKFIVHNVKYAEVVFSHYSPNTLHRVASYLCLLPELAEGQDTTNEKEVLLELLVGAVTKRGDVVPNR